MGKETYESTLAKRIRVAFSSNRHHGLTLDAVAAFKVDLKCQRKQTV